MTLPHHSSATNAGVDNTDDYAHRIARLRQQECPHLVDACYLDAAASPPLPAGLVARAAADLTAHLFSNPHSRSPSAVYTAERIQHARTRVMTDLFGIQDTRQWALVFTAGTTASLKLVAESFDWAQGDYHHLLESHTSLAAISDLARDAGARSSTFQHHAPPPPSTRADLVALPLQCNATGRRYHHLLADLCRQPQRGSRYVLVDAASFLSSSQRLDLGSMPLDDAPDFVAFSFYKVFGYPTGLGGLLVKKSSAHALCNKRFYGGGTLDAVAPGSAWKRPRQDLAAAFEDGTVNMHAILALTHAFDYYSESFGTWTERGAYVESLARVLHTRLAGIRHGNGAPVVRVYTTSHASKRWRARAAGLEANVDAIDSDQGPILNFNLLSPSGQVVPPHEVDRLASVSNIHIRTGKHCNAGFVASALGITDDDIKQQYARGVGCDESSDSDDLVSTTLRASVCLLNTIDDIERLGRFVERFFQRLEDGVPSSSSQGARSSVATTSAYRLSQVVVYPIKSCAGQHLAEGEQWPLARHGLAYDREWVLLDLRSGKGLSQKKYPLMALIQPRVDRQRNRLVIAIAGRDEYEVELEGPGAEAAYEAQQDDLTGVEGVQVCADQVRPRVHASPALRSLLSEHLGVPCTLARQTTGAPLGRHSKMTLPSTAGGGGGGGGGGATDRIPLLLSNESPFLLINQASVNVVSGWLEPLKRKRRGAGTDWEDTTNQDVDPVPPLRAHASSFRGNFVISPASPPDIATAEGREEEETTDAWVEDTASRFTIGRNRFGVLGGCRRCQMVCVDQTTGEVRPETLQALARHRRNERGRIVFGSHLVWLDAFEPGGGGEEVGSAEGFVEVGMAVGVE